MTRENKIGLLVGLAFIIAVGILLSDHLSTTDEPTPAPLPIAGSAVRQSLGDAVADSGSDNVVSVPPRGRAGPSGADGGASWQPATGRRWPSGRS